MPETNTLTAPILVKNPTAGPVVFFVDRQNSFEWAGHGDPTGEDLQPVPATLLQNVYFIKALRRGVLEIVDQTPEIETLLDQQNRFYQSKLRAEEERVASTIQHDATDDFVQVACIGPSSRGTGKCDQPAMVRQSEKGSVPPLCSGHQGLRSQIVTTVEPDPTDPGKQVTTFEFMPLGNREKDQTIAVRGDGTVSVPQT